MRNVQSAAVNLFLFAVLILLGNWSASAQNVYTSQEGNNINCGKGYAKFGKFCIKETISPSRPPGVKPGVVCMPSDQINLCLIVITDVKKFGDICEIYYALIKPGTFRDTVKTLPLEIRLESKNLGTGTKPLYSNNLQGTGCIPKVKYDIVTVTPTFPFDGTGTFYTQPAR
jgi:hypothetical protein